MDQKPRGSDDSELLRTLNRHPKIKARLRELLEIAEAKGEVVSADEIEGMLVEIVRDLGRTTINDWAGGVQKQIGQEMASKKPAVYRNKKKR